MDELKQIGEHLDELRKRVLRMVSRKPHRHVGGMRMHGKLAVCRLVEVKHADTIIFKDHFHLVWR